MPDWLLDLLKEGPVRSETLPQAAVTEKGRTLPPTKIEDWGNVQVPAGEVHPWAQAALRNEAASVANADEGSRNILLNNAAFKLGNIVGGGFLDRGIAEETLEEAASQSGLEQTERRATIRSGIDAGVKSPRTPLTHVRRHEVAADGVAFRKAAKRKILQAAQNACREQGGGRFRMSYREAGDRAGCAPSTALRWLGQLEEDGWLAKEATEELSDATFWRLTLPADLDLRAPGVARGHIEALSELISHDAFRWQALGAASLTLTALALTPDEEVPSSELAARTGRHPRTERHHAQRLTRDELAERGRDGWRISPKGTDPEWLDELAERYGTGGRGEEQRRRNESERMLFDAFRQLQQSTHSRRIDPKTGEITTAA